MSTTQIRASPLEEWEGGVNIAMSNTVTTSIRSSVRGMDIGKTRTTDKADRATVENINNNYFITFIVEYSDSENYVTLVDSPSGAGTAYDSEPEVPKKEESEAKSDVESK
ncbi:non-specific serine/threonine protein kinase [Trifolium repens]|nr:non-specific serine/threonine protein kinase [Trifolium repens]